MAIHHPPQTSSWDHCSINSQNTTTGRETPPPHDIPKELYQMVDFLSRRGLQEVSLTQTHTSDLIGACDLSFYE